MASLLAAVVNPHPHTCLCAECTIHSLGFEPPARMLSAHGCAAPHVHTFTRSHTCPLFLYVYTRACWQYGVDLMDRQLGRRGYVGRTALHWAARNGQNHVIEWLLDTLEAPGGSYARDVAGDWSGGERACDVPTDDGTTAFCLAAWQGQIETCRLLVQRGCDPHTVNSYGCNVFMWVSTTPHPPIPHPPLPSCPPSQPHADSVGHISESTLPPRPRTSRHQVVDTVASAPAGWLSLAGFVALLAFCGAQPHS